MTLEEIRAQIDQIDPEIRELIMKRLDCSREVALAKQASGDITIYRADREEALLSRLGEGVPEDRKAAYLAVVRKIMETSRMYQYGILFDRMEGLFDPLIEGVTLQPDGTHVKVRLSRPDRPGAMSSILSMIGDHGFNMEAMQQICSADTDRPCTKAGSPLGQEQGTDHTDITCDRGTVCFELTIRGNLGERSMQKLMFQLSMESEGFQILEQY